MQQSQGPNIKPASSRIKPQRGAALNEFEALTRNKFAYLDSVELFFPKFFRMSDPKRKLKACEDKGAIWGWRLVVQKPDKDVLRELQHLQQKYNGKVFRVDLALDLVAASKDDAERLQNWLLQRTLLKSRHNGPMLEIDGSTFYWVDYRRRKAAD
jgi:hypothetical protein